MLVKGLEACASPQPLPYLSHFGLDARKAGAFMIYKRRGLADGQFDNVQSYFQQRNTGGICRGGSAVYGHQARRQRRSMPQRESRR
jgi:hypothetical protein